MRPLKCLTLAAALGAALIAAPAFAQSAPRDTATDEAN